MKALKLAALYLALGTGAIAQPLEGIELQGDMRALSLSDLEAVSDATFTDPEDGEHALADFAGDVVVLNFWATWCAPCREEMPELDALQRQLGEDGVEVVTVATGRNPIGGIEAFFEDTGVEALPMYLDPRQALARDMGVLGLPVTVLIDAEGREVARLTGAADWSSPEALAVIEAIRDN